MGQPVILYLHGFTSGPQSIKARVLGQRVLEAAGPGHFVCPQLPASPAAAIALCDALIREHGISTAVGSSLGGFYATCLAERHGLSAVMVNPAIVPYLGLEHYLGTQHWLYTGEPFEFTRQHIAELQAMHPATLTRPERYWLLVEEGDELLDYRHAVARYAGARQTVLPGGDHTFTRWTDYLDDVLRFAGIAA